MSIYQYPNYLEFIKNEQKTLSFLKTTPFIKKAFNTLSGNAEISLYNLPKKDKDLRRTELNFGSNFNIVVEKKVRRIAVEALVKPQFNVVTYVLSICENDIKPYNLVRKFHFDYAIPREGQDPKPVYHIQYGGKESPQILEMEVDVNFLHPWLSSPRINFYPINLALLLDLIFNEFESEETVGIVRRSEWRDIIKTNEDLILKPFYHGISQFLTAEHRSNFLMRDFYYGKL